MEFIDYYKQRSTTVLVTFLDGSKLYCIVLYCIVLYCIVLYCIVWYCMVLYYEALY